MANLLLISGLDPSGGAGFIADARIAEQHRLRPIGVVSALTEQTTAGVRAVHSPGAELVSAQLTGLLSDIQVAGGKIGLVADEECAAAIAGALALTGAPVVWDPVLRAGAGDTPLFRGEPRRAFELLRPHLALVTPNLGEAQALVGFPVDGADSMRRAAAAIAAEGVACLVTGGHLGGPELLDVLCQPGAEPLDFEADRVPGGEHVHGTGCVLSTAIACRLALGAALEAAVRGAGELVRQRLRSPVMAGRGRPSVV